MSASAEGEINIVVKAKDKTGGVFGNISKSFSSLGKAAVTGVAGGVAVAGAAVTGVAIKGVQEFVKFEDQLNEVFTLLPNISQEAMGQMKEQVLDASVAMGRLPEEVIPALYQSLSAGVPQDNVFEFLDVAHKAALGGVTELETAVDGISSVVNAYGSDVIGASEASDLMFTAVRLGKTTFGELSDSLSNVTPIASAMGVNFGDVTAALAAMTSQGTPTAQATTQMRALLQELGTAGTEVSDVFEEVAGKSFLDFIDSGGSVSEALQMLEQYAGDTGIPLQDLFGNVRAGLGALQLSGKGAETYAKNLEEMGMSAGATNTAFETMNTGFARTLEVLQAKFKTTFIEIGDALSPFIGMVGEKLLGAFDSLEPVIDNVTKFLTGLFEVLFGKDQAFGDTSFHIAGIVEKLQAIIETGGSLREFFVIFEDGSSNLDALFQLFGMGEEEAQLLASQISQVAMKVFEIKDAVVEFLTPIWEAISSFVSFKDILIVAAGVLGVGIIAAISAVVSAIGPILLAIGAAIAIVSVLRNAWENNWGGIQEKVKAVINFLRNLIDKVVSWIRAFWEQNGDAILASAKQVWETIKMVITTVVNTIKQIITTVMNAIRQFWTDHGEQIKQTAERIWEGIKTIIDTFLGIVKSVFAAFKSAFEGDWRGFGENLREAWDQAWEAIKTAFTNAKSALLTTMKNIVTGIIDKIKEIDWKQLGIDIIQGIADGVSTSAQIIADAVMRAVKAAWEAALGFLGIESPSKLFMEIGKNTMKGFAVGILNEQKRIASSINSVFGYTGLPKGSEAYQQNQTVSETRNLNLTLITQQTDSDIISNFRIMNSFASEI